ncbi:MAG TPA: helix-turn-helix domain-containing protein [Burkholderiales bacterium]|nr:helix-turn-helix domain-containing protein [Burkholderiales bacterium]
MARMAEANPNVRTRILTAAFNLLADHGVGELTQPRVAKAAGVRTSHLTYYFPTRNDLLLEAARHTVQMLVNALKESVAAAPAKVSSVTKIFENAVANKRLARLMLALIAASDEDKAVKAPLRELIRSERAHLADVMLCAGLTVDRERLALVHAMLVGAAVLNLARDNAESAAEARAIVQFALSDLAEAQPPKRAARKSR